MIANRSAPPGPIVPTIEYQDVPAAIDWLRGAFGFTERLRTPREPDGSIHHAQLTVGTGSVILTSRSGPPPASSLETIMVYVQDLDRHCERARQFGARILSAPDTKPFGERQYNAEDLEGRRWTFSQSVADVPPQNWGAAVSDLTPAHALRPRPSFCYLQIPAADAHRSAAFYAKVFGWNIRHADTDRPTFDDASANVSGAWVANRPPASRGSGILPYIWVDDIHATLALAAANGAEILEPPRLDAPDSTSWIATFLDPAGNSIGLYQESAPSVG